MGEGNTVSDCTNPLRSIRLPKHKKGIHEGHAQHKAPDQRLDGKVHLLARGSPSIERLRKGKLKTLASGRPLSDFWAPGFWPHNCFTVIQNNPPVWLPRSQATGEGKSKEYE
jgi:hypothetical protein